MCSFIWTLRKLDCSRYNMYAYYSLLFKTHKNKIFSILVWIFFRNYSKAIYFSFIEHQFTSDKKIKTRTSFLLMSNEWHIFFRVFKGLNKILYLVFFSILAWDFYFREAQWISVYTFLTLLIGGFFNTFLILAG